MRRWRPISVLVPHAKQADRQLFYVFNRSKKFTLQATVRDDNFGSPFAQNIMLCMARVKGRDKVQAKSGDGQKKNQGGETYGWRPQELSLPSQLFATVALAAKDLFQ